MKFADLKIRNEEPMGFAACIELNGRDISDIVKAVTLRLDAEGVVVADITVIVDHLDVETQTQVRAQIEALQPDEFGIATFATCGTRAYQRALLGKPEAEEAPTEESRTDGREQCDADKEQ